MSTASRAPAPTAAELRATFDAQAPLTVGLEEELMLLDPAGGLAPLAEDVLQRLGGDSRFTRELPAAQLEIRTSPEPAIRGVVDQLAAARRDLAAMTGGDLRPAAAGAHPLAPAEGALSEGPRYERLATEYGPYARRQLVCALQVHVAPGSADRALSVYNALRSYLPEIAALAANAPFHEGRDTGLASVRPKIAESLPRQGVPPRLASWEEHAAALRWGAASGSVPDAGAWWWELRPHAAFGTLELRVPDAQTTVAEAAGVAAFAQCLVAGLAQRFDAGELLDAAPTWRIEENRWSAARHGLDGELIDLISGERVATRDRLRSLIDALTPVAARLGCESELGEARNLVEANGAIRQRAVAESDGLERLVEWLAKRWLEGL